MDKMPTLRKIKRAASQQSSQRFCSTFNFTQGQPSHPLPDQWTVDNLEVTFDRNGVKNINFAIGKLISK
jgi:hypothetical protein